MCKKKNKIIYKKGQMFTIDFFIALILLILLLLSYNRFEQYLDNNTKSEDYLYISRIIFSDKGLVTKNKIYNDEFQQLADDYNTNYDKLIRETGLYEKGKNFYLELTVLNISDNSTTNRTIGKTPDQDNMDVVYVNRYFLDKNNNIVIVKMGVY